jgi:hypothetical protein
MSIYMLIYTVYILGYFQFFEMACFSRQAFQTALALSPMIVEELDPVSKRLCLEKIQRCWTMTTEIYVYCNITNLLFSHQWRN